MNKITLICCLIATNILITGCGSDKRKQATCTTEIDVNLPSESIYRNSTPFNPLDPVTYNASASISIADFSGEVYINTIYFVKTDELPNAWDTYFYFDDIALDIPSGEVGSNGQYKAQLQFNDSGQLITIVPDPILSEELILNGNNYFYVIEYIFSKSYTTQLNSGFAVSALSNYCVVN